MDTLEMVLRLSHGAYRVPLCTSAKILGIAPRTIYNRLSLGKWPLVPLRDNGRVFFSAYDLAEMIKVPQITARRGAPRKSESVKAAQAGVTVAEWRRGGGR